MLVKALVVGMALVAVPSSMEGGGGMGRDAVHVPYRAGEIDQIIASNPSTDDLIRAMLVGDDAEKVDMLIEAILAEDAGADLVAMR